MVTQKISYFEIIYHSLKRCAFFYMWRRMCVNFLKFSIDFFGANCIFIDVNRKQSQSFRSKNVSYVYNYYWKKSSETFQSVVLNVYIFYFIAFLILEDKLKYFSVVLRSKSMFCEHYFLSQVKNIGSIKRHFYTFPFRDCFVFH